ncbi:hypothetical protein OY671_011050, partial [Metschnikowia pulcherrima]
DSFPRGAVGSVAGSVGFGGSMGGVVFNSAAGFSSDHGFGYGFVSGSVSTFHIVAFSVISLTWRGKTVPPQPHFCTNPMDSLDSPNDSMAGFRFHGWSIVEIFTDTGHVGIGNAALSPRVTKQAIDSYSKPSSSGKDPYETEF